MHLIFCLISISIVHLVISHQPDVCQYHIQGLMTQCRPGSVSTKALEDLKSQMTTMQGKIEGITALEAKVKSLEAKIKQRPVIGFQVALTVMEQNNAPAKIAFNKVMWDSANGWNQVSHTFIAPVDGLYWFQLNIMNWGTSRVFARIMKGSTTLPVCHINEKNNFATATNNAVVYVKKGEQVYAQLMQGSIHGDWIKGGVSNQYYYTTFSGFLI